MVTASGWSSSSRRASRGRLRQPSTSGGAGTSAGVARACSPSAPSPTTVTAAYQVASTGSASSSSSASGGDRRTSTATVTSQAPSPAASPATASARTTVTGSPETVGGASTNRSASTLRSVAVSQAVTARSATAATGPGTWAGGGGAASRGASWDPAPGDARPTSPPRQPTATAPHSPTRAAACSSGWAARTRYGVISSYGSYRSVSGPSVQVPRASPGSGRVRRLRSFTPPGCGRWTRGARGQAPSRPSRGRVPVSSSSSSIVSGWTVSSGSTP